MSFLFFSNTFRLWLGQHLNDYSSDEPTFITFLLSLFYVLFVGFGCLSCVSEDIAQFKFNSYIDKRIFLQSTVFVFIGYSLLFCYPNICSAITEHNIEQERNKIEQNYLNQLETNQILQKNRSNKTIDLSFKGIKLGISYDTDIQTAEAIPDFSNGSEQYYSIKLDGKVNPLDLSSITENHWYHPDTIDTKSGSIKISGRLFSGLTTIDNESVEVEIFEYQQRVPLIVIKLNMSAEAFKHLISLYSNKYGEAERMTKNGTPYHEDAVESYHRRNYSSLYYSDFKHSEKNDYVWTFRNGSIRISPKEIVYLSNEFANMLLQENDKLRVRTEQREKFVEDSIKKETKRREALERQKAYDDSVRRANNHKNAINEI